MTSTQITEIANILERDKDSLCGGEPIEAVADEWAAAGFGAAGVEAWALQAGCWLAEDARKLSDAGITPAEAATKTDAGEGAYRATIGYKVANGDLGVAHAVELARSAR